MTAYPYVIVPIIEEKVLGFTVPPNNTTYGLYTVCTGEEKVHMYWVEYMKFDPFLDNESGLRKVCRLFYTYDKAWEFCDTLSSDELLRYSIPGCCY